MRRRHLPALTLLLGALLCAPAPAAAQRDDLVQVYASVTSAWARGSAGSVADLSLQASVDIGDGPMGPLGSRQVAAMLRRVFDDVETVSVSRGMLERVGGNPPRAFGSINWVARAEGTAQPVRRTVYFALTQTPSGWRVTEIRVLR